MSGMGRAYQILPVVFKTLNDDEDRYGHSPRLGTLRRRRCSSSFNIHSDMSFVASFGPKAQACMYIICIY